MDIIEQDPDVVGVLYNTSEDTKENKENPDERREICAEHVEVIPEVIPGEIQKLIVDFYGSIEEKLVEVKKVLLEYKDCLPSMVKL